MKTFCLNCDEALKGRAGKLFCNNYCKSNYHYVKNKPNPQSIFSKIDKQLKLNRRLLQKFNQAGKSTIRKEKMLQAGFNPSIFTHYWKNKKGQVYLFCYDVGFLELEENGKTKYVLVDYQEQYMGKI
tara:strand:+ start:170 stop:550 length:381 start_codon:yes stop_codon:yes gene_type:complete